ncbi:hypothetical protein C1646_521585 [Rhizophagus diaphanus]|nr:hypothetical protein C1646_521585 [Rhizophagus diaphanus] [Rhizophagus sp. MUCL 43196]
MEGKRELRRSPRLNKSPKRRRNSLLPPPTKSILKKSEDTTNFDILQDENTTTTNVLGSLWESNTTIFTRNFEESEITENYDGQKRRKSLGRRVSFASKARVRLFDKDEATENQEPEQDKSNSLNGNKDEASEFMLSIPTPSPNDSMIENVESSSSTTNQSEEDGKGKYAKSTEKKIIMISNDNQSTSQNMSQAQNSNTQMICQNNTVLGPVNDQKSFKDHDDTFASKDMSLVSMIGPTSIERHDTTSTSVCPCDMTLVSIVNQSPSGNHEITNTSVDAQDMTLASMVGLPPSENCHTSMNVQDTMRISMANQPSSENCTSMNVRDMTLASMVGVSPSEDCHTSMNVQDTTRISMVNQPSSENCTSMDVRDMTLASMVGVSPSKNCHTSMNVQGTMRISMVNQPPSENCTSIGVRDMTLASMVGLSPSESCHTSMDVQDTARISIVNRSPSENCTSMDLRDMTIASMVGMSPSGNNTLINVKEMTLASLADQSPPKSMGDKNMTPTSMINRSPSESTGDKLTPIINQSPSKSIEFKNLTLTSMVSRSPSDFKDMTLASMVDMSSAEIHKITSTPIDVNDITTADHSIISSEDMSLVSEENIYNNDKRTIFQRLDINLQPNERRETTLFDVTDASLINEANVKLCDGTTAMLCDEDITDIVINETINTGDLNIKECQKSDFADTEEMKFMKAMIEEQNQQIEFFEAELEGINKETQSLREMRDYLIKEKAEIEQKIRDAKRLVEGTQCYTEKDLNEVQEQYRILIDKHKWFPKKLSEELVHLVYDETVQVKIDTRDPCKRDDTNIPFVEVSLDLNDDMKYDEKLYYQAIFGGIQKFALNYKGTIEIAACSRIVKPIATYWRNSKQLYRDYRVLRFKLPTEIIDSQIINNEKSIIMMIRVNFFNYKAKTNFYIKFLFRWEDVISYPNISNLLWEIEVIYGKVNDPFIKETLNKHLSSNVLGCIRDSCVVIQKNGFVF